MNGTLHRLTRLATAATIVTFLAACAPPRKPAASEKRLGPALDRAATILFNGTYASAALADGGVAVPDERGGRLLVFDPAMHPRCAVIAPDAFTQPSALRSITALKGTVMVRFEVEPGYGLLRASTTSCEAQDTLPVQRGLPGQPIFGDIVALGDGRFVRATWSDNTGFVPWTPGPVPVLVREDSTGLRAMWLEPPRRDSTLLAGIDNAALLTGTAEGAIAVAWRFRDIVALIDTAGHPMWRTHLNDAKVVAPSLTMEDGKAYYRNLTVRTYVQGITARGERLFVLAYADSVGFMNRPPGWRRVLVTLDLATGSILHRDTLPAEFTGVIALGVDGETLIAPKADLFAAFDTASRERFVDIVVPRLDDSGSVSTAANRGSLQIINYFAEYCGPCHAEFPWLVKLDTEFRARGLRIVGLSIDADRNEGREFLEAFPSRRFPVGWVGPSGLKAVGIPMTLIVDQSGGIVQTIYGFPDSAGFDRLRQRVDSLLTGARS